MRDFSDITVVSVTGLQAIAPGAARAIVQSVQGLPGSRGLLISPQRPDELPAGIDHVAIKPFGYFEYSLFVLYALNEFIETEFALIVQDDGWVLNGNNWRPEFFEFDYLGAPIHLARVTCGQQVQYESRFRWMHSLAADDCLVENIYNGGFSLRSKRLLEAPRKYGLEFTVPMPAVSAGPPYALQWDGDVVLEDVWLCLVARQRLEAEGLVFPSVDVAKYFSIEHATPDLHTREVIDQVFGHHSKLRKLVATNPLEIIYGISYEEIQAFYGEAWIHEMFQKRGYNITIQPV
jgi:Protein of unknown function (DUF5672)